MRVGGGEGVGEELAWRRESVSYLNRATSVLCPGVCDKSV
jgi:hypothetical protein